MRLIYLIFIAFGMAYADAMVSVYLRRHISFAELGTLSFSQVGDFLRMNNIFIQEISRHIAMLFMLLGSAMLSSGIWKDRLVAFMWTFAIWDMLYYLFVRIWTGWPSSIMDLTVVFVPLPLVVPILMPLLLSVLLAGIALIMFSRGKS